MFGRLKFRVLTKNNIEAALNITGLLRNEGFEVYDCKESNIIKSSDSSDIGSVYVLCCVGLKSNYKKFKKKYQFTEIEYEGYETLM